jgi:hypothetical protein
MVGAVTGPTSRGMSEHLAAGGDRRDTNGATEDVGVPSQQRPVRERERQRLAPRDREGADERVAGADSALAMVVEVPAHVNGATGDRDALDVAVGEGDPAAAASHRPIRGDAPAVAADPRNERGRAGAQRLRRPGGVGGIRGNPAGRELSATRCGCALPFTLVKSPPARTRPPPRTVESAFGCHLPSLAVEPVAIATRRWRLLPLMVVKLPPRTPAWPSPPARTPCHSCSHATCAASSASPKPPPDAAADAPPQR